MAKEFYYRGKNYLNAPYIETYTRESRWKAIRYTTSGTPYFLHQGRRYKLDNFLSLFSPWATGYPTIIRAADGEEISLAGSEADVYYKPLFIELEDGGERCRVYRYEGTTTEY